MLTILQNNSAPTMTSFDLYRLINNCREQAGEPKVRVNDFNARIADELEGENYESFVVQNPNKTETTAYNLTIEQCMLVGMRESKSVRRSVIEKLKQLSDPKFNIPQTLPEALRLAADLADQLAIAAPKVAVYD